MSSEYILNLTDFLIGSNRLDHFLRMSRPKPSEEFRREITLALLVNGVHEMQPETLGRIMGEFEDGEIEVSADEFRAALRYTGDCTEAIRGLVAFCLACVITDRLIPVLNGTPKVPYPRKGAKVVAPA